MVRRNPHLTALEGGYLFPEIERRKTEFLKAHPDAHLANLGIGDTTLPLPKTVAEAMGGAALKLSTKQGYVGYGPETGSAVLRQRISEVIYRGVFSQDEILVSDGVNSDISRLQVLFGSDVTVAVLDPAYPVYRDGSLINGVRRIIPLPTLPENGFFPDLQPAEGADLIYFCSPNNPTGVAATAEQLKRLVDFARDNNIIILYDAAYAPFIQEEGYPRSIFEIEGAEKVAIELGSFSKFAGFTGVRLSWSALSKKLKYTDGRPLLPDWTRLVQTSFNGPSCLAQAGGLAVLTEEGLAECQKNNAAYLAHAKELKERFQALTKNVYGGTHAPYLWAHFPNRRSWDVFQDLLENHHLLTLPGSGFGPSGEGFIRASAFSLQAVPLPTH